MMRWSTCVEHRRIKGEVHEDEHIWIEVADRAVVLWGALKTLLSTAFSTARGVRHLMFCLLPCVVCLRPLTARGPPQT